MTPQYRLPQPPLAPSPILPHPLLAAHPLREHNTAFLPPPIRLTDLPLPILSKILLATLPPRLPRCTCPNLGKGTMPLPLSLLAPALTCRTFARAVAEAIPFRSNSINMRDVCKAPRSWIVALAPAIAELDLTTIAACSCSHQVGVPCTKHASKHLSWLSDCAKGDIVEETTRLLWLVAPGLHTLILPDVPHFIAALSRIAFPDLRRFSVIIERCAPTYGRFPQRLLIALSQSPSPPRLRILSFNHVLHAPRFPPPNTASFRSLHNLLSPVTGLCITQSPLGMPDLTQLFMHLPALTHVEWVGALLPANTQPPTRLCPQLQGFYIHGMTTLKPRDSRGAFRLRHTPISPCLRDSENLQAIMTTVNAQCEVNIDMRLRGLSQLTTVIETRLPLRKLELSIGRRSLPALHELFVATRRTLTSFYLTYHPDELPEEHGPDWQMTAIDWATLAAAVGATAVLKILQVRLSYFAQGGSLAVVEGGVSACLRALGTRGKFVFMDIPCGDYNTVEHYLMTQTRVIRVARVHCPNIINLDLRFSRLEGLGAAVSTTSERLVWDSRVTIGERRKIMMEFVYEVHDIVGQLKKLSLKGIIRQLVLECFERLRADRVHEDFRIAI